MKISQALLVIVAAAALTSCASKMRPPTVTVQDLITSPTKFDGQPVVVRGFFLMPMTGDLALYDTEEDYHQQRSERSVRVVVDRSKRNLMPFQVKMCLVEGTFHASHDTGVRDSIGEVANIDLTK